jgi:hypothetical protein
VWGGMDWTYLTQDRNEWRAVVKTALNFGFYKICGNSVVDERLLASRE